MLILVILLHIIISLLLIVVILTQSGRGGGLTEGLAAGAESIFGSKTNVFMVRATTVLAILFLITTLSLAYLSTRRNQSLMERVRAKVDASTAKTVETETEEAAAQQKEQPQKEDLVPIPAEPDKK